MEGGFTPVQILLVEDNPDDVEITKRAFTKSRVANDLTIVRDGQEALDYLFGRGAYAHRGETQQPDLVLLDVNLPKMNGIEVLEKIRNSRELAILPVVMLTASAREEDIVKSYQLGSNTYIQKPVEFSKFVHALEILSEYWIVVAKLPQKAA
jgi:two-component system response regulator